jgi:hypothetical protein
MKTNTENAQSLNIWLLLSILGAVLAIATWIRLFTS